MAARAEEATEGAAIRMLFDGECALCKREVAFLRGRDEGAGRIDFVDIAAPDYDPAANQGLSYEAAMEEIHAILPDGTVVRGIEVFRRLYEEVGLGFVYAATKNEAVERAANRVYGFWARFRMQLTGRGDMAAVLAKRAAGDASTCRQGVGGGEPGAGSPP